MTSTPPRISVVILTKDEVEHVDTCLASLFTQSVAPHEVIVVDAASTDGTADRITEWVVEQEGRVRAVLAAERLSVGAARNRGVREARGDAVAFISADAQADRHWIEAASAALLSGADVVYGRQVHAPRLATPAAVSRGLRYHHFHNESATPTTFASNVNAVIRRNLLIAHPFTEDATESALDDVLFAREAAGAGARIRYVPAAIVYHTDVSSMRGEVNKLKREGRAWGLLSGRVGLPRAAMAWALALASCLAWLAVAPGLAPALVALVVAFVPGMRRLLATRERYPLGALAAALLLAPLLDAYFVVNVLRGLARRARGSPSGPRKKVPA